MPKNPFIQQKEFVDKPNRNTFDMSHTNNLTMKIGKYIPIMCQPVLPGDSGRIKPTFGLRLMPMVFPIQTRLTARMHFFFVRNKNLWKNWQNFIGQQKQVEMPSVKTKNFNTWKVGGIADYLGVPVTYHGDWTASDNVNMHFLPVFNASGNYNSFMSIKSEVFGTFNDAESINVNLGDSNNFSYGAPSTTIKPFVFTLGQEQYPLSSVTASNLFGTNSIQNDAKDVKLTWNVNTDGVSPFPNGLGTFYVLFFDKSKDTKPVVAFRKIQTTSLSQPFTFDIPLETTESVGNENLSDGYYINELKYSDGITYEKFQDLKKTDNLSMCLVVECRCYASSASYNTSLYSYAFFTSNFPVVYSDYTSVAEMKKNPYVDEYLNYGSDAPVLIKRVKPIDICALPFRAYESIYNGFYRDTRNNPLMINGEPEYNQFITTDADGPDFTNYDLFNANWEADWFTTATQTPQQGIAPLIGVTGTGLMSFQDDQGNTIYAQASIGDDGQTIIGIDSHDSKLPDGTLQILQDTISAGISINDIRNVNALQRWLERNLRLGFRYRELVKAQFGVDIDWNELNMPEFIGGVTRQIQINQISQTVNGQGGLEDSLGSVAGQGGLVGEGKDIEFYADDYGYIIGIMSVVPTPVYSQSVPKHFLQKSALDFYAPDFAHIGAQPIFNKELAPLQSYVADTKDDNPKSIQDAVFGYQRPWYDYIANVDTAHGQFRTTLRNFLFHRVFDNVPQLGKEFLTVDGSQLNNVFVVNDDTDKIIGEIYFDFSMKRPIPELSIPKLEA